MFFIGIIGVGPKEERRPLEVSIEECASAELIRRFHQFHVFFIPVYRWRFEYFIHCSNGKWMGIKPDKGDALWRGEDVPITYWDLRVLYEEKVCPRCKAATAQGDLYCSRCGMKL